MTATVPLKRVTRFAYGASLAVDDREEGEVPVFGSNGRVGSHTQANTGQPVVIVGRKGSFGKIQYSDAPVFAIDTTYYIDRTQTSNNIRWLYYLLVATDLGAFSADTGVPGLSREAAYQRLVRWVPIDRQHLIADFLDRETHRIDALVDAKRRMIDLLDEKRQTAIDHNVRWPSATPEDVVRLKFVLQALIDTEHKTVHFVPDGDYPVVRTSDIRDGRMLLDQARRTDVRGYVEWTRRGRPTQGDVLLTREAPAGEAAVVPSETSVCIGQRVVLLKLSSRVDPNFLVHSMYSSRTRAFIDLASQGSTVAHLNMGDIPNIPIWAPPMDVQRDVRERLDRLIATIQTTQETLRRQLDLLAEYRQALITQAVTGQLDEATLKGDKPIGEAVGVIPE